jgi:predicted esterase
MERFLGGVFAFVAAVLMSGGPSAAQQGRALEKTIAGMPKSLYFVIPPRQAPNPSKPAGLVVVLPGGSGTRDFLPWVENVLCAQLPDDCVGVMVTAVQWNPAQTVIWAKSKDDAKEMEYSTEQLVRAVVAEVEQQYPIMPERRAILGWSSSGPAIQPLMAHPHAPFSRAYVAMSVWPAKLDLGAVKGRRYVLDHSPEDQQTTFSHCRRAHGALTKAGAVVRVATYAGGHGWHDGPEQRLRENLKWLLGKEPAPKPVWPPGPVASAPGKLVNLVANPGFESGTQNWNVVANSQRLQVAPSKDEKRTGKTSLHLQKTGGAPLDLVRQEVELPAGSKVVAAITVKCKGVASAFVRVWLYGDGDQPTHQDSLLVQLPADGDWQKFERDWPAQDATRAVVQIVMLEGGELWIDDVTVAVVK